MRLGLFPGFYNLHKKSMKFGPLFFQDTISVNNAPNTSVAILLVTHNSSRVIKDCLESLVKSQYDNVNLYIWDNYSEDWDITRHCISKVENLINTKISRSNCNIGFGPAINRLSKIISDEKYLFFINPDGQLDKYTLQNLVSFAELSYKEGFRVWEARQLPFEHPKFYNPVTLETDWFSGACVLLDHEAFKETGGFDENIFLYGEDVDLSWKLRSKGYKICYVPWATFLHNSYEYPYQVKENQHFYSAESNIYLRWKYGNILDILKGYILIFLRLFRKKTFENYRSRFLKHVKTGTFKGLKKLLDRDKVNKTCPATFIGAHYEVRREGAFLKAAHSSDKNPLVSVIIRTVGRPAILRATLQSILNQTYPNIEIIVAEDGDRTAESLLDSLSGLGKRVVYYASEKKIGRSNIGNKGLELSTGEFINFLDDDDYFFADHIEVLANALIDNPSASAAYSLGFELHCRLKSIDPYQYDCIRMGHRYNIKFDRKKLKLSNYIPINTVMFRRRLYEEHGGFDEKSELLEDWDLLLRYSLDNEFIFIPKTTCIYLINLDTSSKRQKILDAAKIT